MHSKRALAASPACCVPAFAISLLSQAACATKARALSRLRRGQALWAGRSKGSKMKFRMKKQQTNGHLKNWKGRTKVTPLIGTSKLFEDIWRQAKSDQAGLFIDWQLLLLGIAVLHHETSTSVLSTSRAFKGVVWLILRTLGPPFAGGNHRFFWSLPISPFPTLQNLPSTPSLVIDETSPSSWRHRILWDYS